MRIAIVQDHLAQAGGAERVIEAMHGVYPDAPIFTAVYDPDSTYPSFRQMDIRTSFLQKFARRQRFFRFAFPLYPLAFEQFDLSGFDVVVSSNSAFAKGVITPPETCHICYCHTPARFAWRYHEYVMQGGFSRNTRRLLPWLVHNLRVWDYVSAQRVDYFLANSRNVSRRIQKYYQRASEIVYPPVDVGRFHVADAPTGDYFLVVSRLLGYKRVDLAVAAMTQANLPLKVVGTGPDEARLRALAGPTIEFLGRRSDAEVVDLLANCRALLFCGEEDFGITPLEAMASGRPVVAYRAGGATETVVEGKTGVFFDTPTPDAVRDAVARLDRFSWEPNELRAHAAKFDLPVFQERFRRSVETLYAQHQQAYAAFPAIPDPLVFGGSARDLDREPHGIR